MNLTIPPGWYASRSLPERNGKKIIGGTVKKVTCPAMSNVDLARG